MTDARHSPKLTVVTFFFQSTIQINSIAQPDYIIILCNQQIMFNCIRLDEIIRHHLLIRSVLIKSICTNWIAFIVEMIWACQTNNSGNLAAALYFIWLRMIERRHHIKRARRVSHQHHFFSRNLIFKLMYIEII